MRRFLVKGYSDAAHCFKRSLLLTADSASPVHRDATTKRCMLSNKQASLITTSRTCSHDDAPQGV